MQTVKLKPRAFSPRPWVVLAMLVLTCLPCAVEASPAVLVVGNAKNQAMAAREKEAVDVLGRLRERLGLDEASLPILVYHFDRADEKAYCQSTLGIQSNHLLFVGLVDHENRAPRKVLSRVNAVTDPQRACLQVMAVAAARLGRDPSALRTAASNPARVAPAQAASGPAAAARDFWVSVNAQQYATSWRLLTHSSRQQIVASVAKDEKMSVARVQTMFDTNVAAVQKGFWESFRKSSRAERYAALTYVAGAVDNNRCVVQARDVASGKAIPLLMFRENEQWRFGLMETFVNK